MLLRSAGIVTIVLSLILSFAGVENVQKLYRLSWLVGGVTLLWLIFSNKWVDQKVQKIMRKLLNRWTDLEVRDYAGLLQLPGDYQLSELEIEEDDWVAEKTLDECTLMEEGVTVLGIYRPNGNYVGVPEGSTQIHAGDVLVLYGRSGVMRELDERKRGHSGDRAHDQAVVDQERQQQNQQRQEREYERERAEES
jgi:NhaP-type Na+/H+ and K+/H+ antiporter